MLTIPSWRKLTPNALTFRCQKIDRALGKAASEWRLPHDKTGRPAEGAQLGLHDLRAGGVRARLRDGGHPGLPRREGIRHCQGHCGSLRSQRGARSSQSRRAAQNGGG